MLQLFCYCSLLLWSLFITFAVSNDCPIRDACTFTPAYYWKDYVGIIPHDAIKGGQDEGGNTTYVGQVVSPNTNGILTAVIYPGKREARSTAGLVSFTHSQYVKILCSKEKRKLEWKQIHVKDMHLLTDYHLVRGGIESDLFLYIGRAFFEGELLVGKVFDDSYWARGLRLPMRNGSEFGFLSFEILLYPRQCTN